VSAASREHRWVPKAELAVVAMEDRVVILDLDHPDGPPMVREGTAWTIWSAPGERETRQGSTNALANAYGVASGMGLRRRGGVRRTHAERRDHGGSVKGRQRSRVVQQVQ
jgi:hypothetical protein